MITNIRQTSIQSHFPYSSPELRRIFSLDNYRFGFNGQEMDNEISSQTGTHTTAMFWEYDSRLGRRWNLDPKPQVSMSDYACFANNPIWFMDPLGDTIRTTKELENDKTAYKAYNTFMNSRQGKKFTKQYGIGGKYENISVVFGNDENELNGAIGDTKVFQVNKNDPTDETQLNLNEQLKGGYFLRFKVNVASLTTGQTFNTWHPGSTDGAGNAAGEQSSFRIAKNKTLQQYKMSNSFLHETQHIRIMHSEYIKYNCWMTHPNFQHKDMMKDKNGIYYKEREDFLNEFNKNSAIKVKDTDLNYFDN